MEPPVKPVAIWYHTIFTGTERPINAGWTMDLMAQQLLTMESVGLVNHAKEMWIGVNGDESDGDIARMLAPSKAKVVAHGKGTGTEITTLNLLRKWVVSHPDWYVFYAHAKGSSHPENPNTRWRLEMERHIIWNWRMVILDLDKGADCCGCYWLTPEEHPTLIQTKPFFGGNFWAAKASYLATLAPLPPPEFVYRYEAESWIGSGPNRPRVKNYVEGWPPQS